MESKATSSDKESSRTEYEGIQTKNEILAHLINQIPRKIAKKSKDRVINVLKAMNRDTINMPSFRSIVFRGKLNPHRYIILCVYVSAQPLNWLF